MNRTTWTGCSCLGCRFNRLLWFWCFLIALMVTAIAWRVVG